MAQQTIIDRLRAVLDDSADKIKRLAAINADLLATLKQIDQRANEGGSGVMAWIDTIHDMNRVACTAVAKAEGPSANVQGQDQQREDYYKSYGFYSDPERS